MKNSQTKKEQHRQQLEQYMREKVKPVFSELYTHCIRARPRDPIKFMIDFLEKMKGNPPFYICIK